MSDRSSATVLLRLLQFAVGALLCMLSSSASWAQEGRTSGRVAVIPMTRRSDRSAEVLQAAEQVEGVLTAQKRAHLAMDEASFLFSRRHSRAPVPWTESEHDLLAQASKRALAAIVAGNYTEALSATQEARAQAERAIESINRSLEKATAAFAYCALRVRTLAEDGDSEGALNAAMLCRAQYPGIEPDHAVHPSHIVKLFAKADALLAKYNTRTLIVDSKPSGCAVFLNGRNLGTTPFREEGLVAHEPRLQVECSDKGHARVHTVPPGAELVHIAVDTVFESAIHTDENALRLSYPTDEDSHVREHVREVLKVLAIDGAIVVSMPSDGQLKLTLVESVGRGGTVVLSSTYAEADLQHAIDQLLSETSPASAENAPLEEDGPPSNNRGKLLWAGLIGTGIGTVGIGVSWWLFGQRRQAGSDLEAMSPTDPRYLATGDDWLADRAPSYWALAASSGVAATGASLVAYSAPELPAWLDYTTLGIGASLAAAGSVELARGARCDGGVTDDLRQCVDDQHIRQRGGLLLLTAFPFLVAPTVHIIYHHKRRADRPTVALLPNIGRREAAMHLSVRF